MGFCNDCQFSLGSATQPPWQVNPAKNTRMAVKPGGTGDAVDSGGSGDANSRVRDFFPAASTKRKPSGNPPPALTTPNTQTNNNNSNGGVMTAGPAPASGRGRRVRTIYACAADHGSELSFEANQIIVNVKLSPEPGWLTGTLNGKEGLIPANYVEFLPDAANAAT